MAVDFSEILVVGVSSRVLFNLEKENEIFNTDGISGFRKYQLEHEEEPYASDSPLLKLNGQVKITKAKDE